MKAVIYFTEVPQQYEHKNMEHMIGEKLLATGLYKEYGLKLAFEPRATGEHGKPFLTLQPQPEQFLHPLPGEYNSEGSPGQRNGQPVFGECRPVRAHPE